MSRNLTLVLLLVALVLLAATLVALIAMTVLALRRARRIEELEARLTPDPDRPQNAAQWAVRTVVDTAARVRERGLVSGLLRTPIEELQRWFTEEREQIRRIAGPDGHLTVMFSDIQGSTALNEELGDREWVKVLRRHDAVVRAAVASQDGYVVKSQGDGFMVIFSDPESAVAAAERIHRKVGTAGRRLRRTPLTVRIGIHCGTVVARNGDFFGRNVAMAARVATLADGGQTLVTDEVAEALEGREDLDLTPLGVVELKGLAGEHQLWLLDPPQRV
ncbi:adenylate/guanylate cyclase domain-containing protein [Nocardioides sp. HDW12B]|uniref:adenylate/guanylate cyclase domain-containing protein n=1 Tax=Nocardioides sp. HDW12B TaxID=2714939 RepID=UPI001F0EB007|nr:adenylate/guanylate cyclase domain-containing protein [Nocardioides sp. HDW12B]